MHPVEDAKENAAGVPHATSGTKNVVRYYGVFIHGLSLLCNNQWRTKNNVLLQTRKDSHRLFADVTYLLLVWRNYANVFGLQSR